MLTWICLWSFWIDQKIQYPGKDHKDTKPKSTETSYGPQTDTGGIPWCRPRPLPRPVYTTPTEAALQGRDQQLLQIKALPRTGHFLAIYRRKRKRQEKLPTSWRRDKSKAGPSHQLVRIPRVTLLVFGMFCDRNWRGENPAGPRVTTPCSEGADHKQGSEYKTLHLCRKITQVPREGTRRTEKGRHSLAATHWQLERDHKTLLFPSQRNGEPKNSQTLGKSLARESAGWPGKNHGSSWSWRQVGSGEKEHSWKTGAGAEGQPQSRWTAAAEVK